MQLSPVRPPRISPDTAPPTIHHNNRLTNLDDTHPTTHPNGSHPNGTRMRELYGRENASDVVFLHYGPDNLVSAFLSWSL